VLLVLEALQTPLFSAAEDLSLDAPRPLLGVSLLLEGLRLRLVAFAAHLSAPFLADWDNACHPELPS